MIIWHFILKWLNTGLITFLRPLNLFLLTVMNLEQQRGRWTCVLGLTLWWGRIWSCVAATIITCVQVGEVGVSSVGRDARVQVCSAGWRVTRPVPVRRTRGVHVRWGRAKHAHIWRMRRGSAVHHFVWRRKAVWRWWREATSRWHSVRVAVHLKYFKDI